MNYEKKLILIKEFKAATKNNDLKPTVDETYGTKYEGYLTYLHYMFYAMLRNKNVALTTHDINAYKYRYRKLQLLSFVDDTSSEIRAIQDKVPCTYNYRKEVSITLKNLQIVFNNLRYST